MDDETTHDSRRGRGEDALVEIAQLLLDNPLLHQALQVAVDARDRASHASASAMRSLNVPAATDVDRLGRRLRALSERLEDVEDSLDQLSAELRQIRKASTAARGSGETQPRPGGMAPGGTPGTP